jgi:hypothetical protein
MTKQHQPKQQPSATLPYQAYLIRLWQDSRQSGWRASAQAVQSDETIRFGTLETLFAFLQDQTRDQIDQQHSHVLPNDSNL